MNRTGEITEFNIREFKAFFLYDENRRGIIRKFEYCGRPQYSKPGSIDKFKNTSYRKIYLKGRQYREHQIVWCMFNGVIPAGMLVDHVNGDGLDNRIENLRCVTRSTNNKNCVMRETNKSGVNGVIWYKATGKWMAYISNNGKRIHLGFYENKADAIEARIAAESQYGYTQRHGKVKCNED